MKVRVNFKIIVSQNIRKKRKGERKQASTKVYMFASEKISKKERPFCMKLPAGDLCRKKTAKKPKTNDITGKDIAGKIKWKHV